MEKQGRRRGSCSHETALATCVLTSYMQKENGFLPCRKLSCFIHGSILGLRLRDHVDTE